MKNSSFEKLNNVVACLLLDFKGVMFLSKKAECGGYNRI